MSLQEFKPDYFTVEDRGAIVIATVTLSTLCEEDNIDQFAVELNQIIEGFGSPWMVLDLHQVTLMTSSAVGKLIGLHRNLRRHDGRLALCCLNGIIRNVFQTAKLIDYFHVASTVDEAVELLTREKSNLEAAQADKVG
jgi:anti-sigma B factor antagonist